VKRSKTVVTIDRDDLIRQFSISYIVIPRNSTVQSGGEMPLELRSLPVHDHLLNDPDLRVVFENSRIIILQIVHQ